MHGIILHEEHRERMKKLGPERVGQIVFNLFRIDDGEEPINFPDDEALDAVSEWVCGRFIRDIEASDRGSRNGSNGGAPAGNQNARKQPKTTKNNQKTTKKQPKNNQNQTPITNNLLPITNNQYKEIKKESDLFVDDVISYLNYVTGRHYQATDKTSSLINARLKEGYTANDFKKVIDKKYREWKGTPYEKFVKPTTLFAPSHFDDYLNQPEPATQDDMFSAFLKGGNNDEAGIYTDSADAEGCIYRSQVHSV